MSKKDSAGGFFSEPELVEHEDYLRDVKRWITEVNDLYESKKLTRSIYNKYWEKLNSLAAGLPKRKSSEPDHFILHEMQALLYDYDGKYDESARSFVKAQELKPKHHNFTTERSQCLSAEYNKGTKNNAHIITSEWRVWFLIFITSGLYAPYLGWKYWEITKRLKYKDVNYKDISPSIRGVFLFFTSFWLFPAILKEAQDLGYRKKFNPSLLAFAYLGAWVLGQTLMLTLSDDILIDFLVIWGILAMLITWPLLPIVNAINYIAKQKKDDSRVVGIGYNDGLIAFLILVAILSIARGFS